ncbi:hypothetical protein [Paenibacillus sp. UNC451MF]|uniref:hypothetical protein n=1 Tax=Paenibacillus sp. UNC451MF TaxID=1449063 RepID=UPI000491127A|nr:hypothetical protein [Paenibacillus sp. UNC451MF]
MASIYHSQTLSVAVQRGPGQVYEYIYNLSNFPEWATSFCLSIRESGEKWIMETPEGPATIRFVEKNQYGVLDHYVGTLSGDENLVSMRVVANGMGSEVLLTAFQLQGMSDVKFAEDQGMVQRDLETLKSVLEGQAV